MIKNSNQKKVLYITVRADYGGGPKHLYQLSSSLSSNFNKYFACPKEFPYFEKYRNLVGSDNIIEVPHRKFSFLTLLEIRKFIKKNNIDFIHSHGKGAGIYSRVLVVITKIDCIHTFHGIHIGQYNFIKKFLYIELERILTHFTKYIIAVSKSEAQQLVQNKIANEDKIKVIENGIPIPCDKVSNPVPASKIFDFISFSRFDYAKNSELLIDIFTELQKLTDINNFHIHILGNGENLENIKIAVQKLFKNNFHFYGNVDNPNEYLKKSFCYISTSRWEGLPLGILEAMSFGLPVIATKVVGNTDLIKHDMNGFLFNIESPKVAAEFMVQLAKDPDSWERFSMNNYLKVKNNFSLEKMVRETENLYNLL